MEVKKQRSSVGLISLKTKPAWVPLSEEIGYDYQPGDSVPQCFISLVVASSSTSTLSVFFWCLSITTVSGWLASSCLSVWNLKSHRTLALVFSTTFSGVYHQDLGTSNPHWVQMFLYTIPATWLCLSIDAVPASILHPVRFKSDDWDNQRLVCKSRRGGNTDGGWSGLQMRRMVKLIRKLFRKVSDAPDKKETVFRGRIRV